MIHDEWIDVVSWRIDSLGHLARMFVLKMVTVGIF